MTAGCPWRVEAGAPILLVRLTPKGGQDAVDGIEPLAERLRVEGDAPKLAALAMRVGEAIE